MHLRYFRAGVSVSRGGVACVASVSVGLSAGLKHFSLQQTIYTAVTRRGTTRGNKR